MIQFFFFEQQQIQHDQHQQQLVLEQQRLVQEQVSYQFIYVIIYFISTPGTATTCAGASKSSIHLCYILFCF
jgi:hypothetical protein